MILRAANSLEFDRCIDILTVKDERRIIVHGDVLTWKGNAKHWDCVWEIKIHTIDKKPRLVLKIHLPDIETMLTHPKASAREFAKKFYVLWNDF